MKHTGSGADFSRERIDDLMRAYDDYMTSCRHIRMPDVYRAVTLMPSRRFWVSDIRAALVVSAMLRGEEPLRDMWPTKREMYMEIYDRVARLREADPALGVSEACSEVVMQEAPKFYITPGTAKVMICKHRKEWVRKKLERLSALSSRRQ